MWTVTQPSYDARQTFLTCISKVKNSDLRRRLGAIVDDIESAGDEYKDHGEAATLYEIATATAVGTVTAAEMVKVYDQRMAGKNAPGRGIYDHIKMLPKSDRCPFCDQRGVSTLDHALPKSSYPALAVCPLNLVGSCMECNKVKNDLSPITAAEVVLHPYFDDITQVQWLKAAVVHQSPCALTFQVEPHASWDAELSQRAVNHFALLGLGKLYTSEAGRELANVRHNLGQHFNAAGAAAVKAELVRQYVSRRANRLNSWQTATYQALSQDDWFCGGGFDA